MVYRSAQVSDLTPRELHREFRLLWESGRRFVQTRRHDHAQALLPQAPDHVPNDWGRLERKARLWYSLDGDTDTARFACAMLLKRRRELDAADAILDPHASEEELEYAFVRGLPPTPRFWGAMCGRNSSGFARSARRRNLSLALRTTA